MNYNYRRYFATMKILDEHKKQKSHKRRARQIKKDGKPHNQKEADLAGGLGSPDNGNKMDVLKEKLNKINL